MGKSSKVEKHGYLHMNFGAVLSELNKSKIAIFGDEFSKTLFYIYHDRWLSNLRYNLTNYWKNNVSKMVLNQHVSYVITWGRWCYLILHILSAILCRYTSGAMLYSAVSHWSLQYPDVLVDDAPIPGCTTHYTNDTLRHAGYHRSVRQIDVWFYCGHCCRWVWL